MNLVLFGDNFGIPLLLKFIPHEYIKTIVAASIRPNYIDEIKQFADSIGSNFIIQPKFNSREYPSFVEHFKQSQFDLLMCNSYSMIIRPEILAIINYNAINVHGALLPKNRGPNPNQWSIIKGETKTGVTIHFIEDGLDCGDIISQKEVDIDFKDTWVSLSDKVKSTTHDLLKEKLFNILTGNFNRTKQNEEFATINKRLNSESPRIDFEKMDDMEIYNLIRAQVIPLKGAYIKINKDRVYYPEFIEYNEIKEIRKKYAK
ncbi:MAG: wbmQ [Ignavibacteria bacterium]|nr:wbmQ [Ignavibacteria bacterium]